jgi:hypothetical protein
MGLRTAFMSARGSSRDNGRAIRMVSAPTIGAMLERLFE